MTTKTDTIEIYSVGTSVALTENVDAKIITIAIHENNSVTYECSWWSGDNRTKDWFSSSDFLNVGEKDPTTKIGFIRSISVYKSKLKWLFIAGFVCGATLGTAIIEMWIK